MPSRHRRWVSDPRLWLLLTVACLAGAVASFTTGCSGWDPSEPFTRNAPEVDEAIAMLDAGQYESAEEALAAYLGTGPCGDAGLGLPPTVRDRANGSFDLGLTLFHLAEKYGRRFGEEEQAQEDPEAQQQAAQRSLEIECAQIVVKAIASDPKVPIDLRARAFYLSGNLEFLRQDYEAAIRQYDQALELVPAVVAEAGGDEVGRDAAWNRAIALRRLQEQDAGADAEPDSSDGGGDEQDGSQAPEAGEDASDDAETDGGMDDGGPESGAPDAGDEGDGGEEGPSDGGAQDGGDAGSDDPNQAPPPEPQDEDGQTEPPPASQSQMDRVLDQLEEAPTYQEEEAKKRVGVRRRYRMEDK